MQRFSNLFGKENVVGIDIGSRLIKTAQVEAGGGGQWRVTRAAVAPTPPGSVKEGIIVEPAAVGEAIRTLLRLTDIQANAATAAISGASVIVRHVKLPRMPESVLRKSIRFEASKYISSSIDDSIIEFEINGPVPGEPDKMSVMLVAAPNPMVNSRLAALTAAGLEPTAVDVEGFALQRALLDLSSTKPGEGVTLALLDIGALHSDVNIVTDGQFVLTRNIAIAGDSFTNALKGAAPGKPWADLETLKTQVDMAALLDPAADPDAAGLARTVQPVMDELLREVRRSINYYQSQLTDTSNSNLPVGVSAASGNVTKLVVTGGSARFPGLKAYMMARLGVPIEVWNVFDNPAFDSTSFVPNFVRDNQALLATGIGLALKDMVESAPARRAPSRPAAGKAA